jgi:hypothetical protein
MHGISFALLYLTIWTRYHRRSLKKLSIAIWFEGSPLRKCNAKFVHKVLSLNGEGPSRPAEIQVLIEREEAVRSWLRGDNESSGGSPISILKKCFRHLNKRITKFKPEITELHSRI